jgi:hypothetical protein
MKEKLKEKKPYYLIIARKTIFWLVMIMLIGEIAVLIFKDGIDRYRVIFTMVQLIAMLFVLRVPQFILNKFHFQIPYLLDFILVVFAFCAFILGDVFDFYNQFPFWDSLLHTFSGIIIAYICFLIVRHLDKEYTIPISISPMFICIIVVCVALALGAGWEICEYISDDIFNTNSQQYMASTDSTLYNEKDIPLAGHEALQDTMKDLMLDLAGALVVATIGYQDLEKKRKKDEAKNGS